MIWLDGQVVESSRLTIPIADRIFEHGLGLFETFRTWNGRTWLLPRHLDRITRSARVLKIALNSSSLPTPGDAEELVRAVGVPDAIVRLTLSAGREPDLASSAWMTANPLPLDRPEAAWQVVDAAWPVAIDDPLARHKTLNYWSKRIAFDQARELGADEAVFASADGRVWEGSRSNLFLVNGRDLITPPRTGPIIPGIMRELVLELAEAADLRAIEADITGSSVDEAEEIFLTNSVRGLIPVGSWAGRSYRPSDPDFPKTSQLRELIETSIIPRNLRA